MLHKRTHLLSIKFEIKKNKFELCKCDANSKKKTIVWLKFEINNKNKAENH